MPGKFVPAHAQLSLAEISPLGLAMTAFTQAISRISGLDVGVASFSAIVLFSNVVPVISVLFIFCDMDLVAIWSAFTSAGHLAKLAPPELQAPKTALKMLQHILPKRINMKAHRGLGSIHVAMADRLKNPLVFFVDTSLMARGGKRNKP